MLLPSFTFVPTCLSDFPFSFFIFLSTFLPLLPSYFSASSSFSNINCFFLSVISLLGTYLSPVPRNCHSLQICSLSSSFLSSSLNSCCCFHTTFSHPQPLPGEGCDTSTAVPMQYDQPPYLKFDFDIKGYACTDHPWVLQQQSNGLTGACIPDVGKLYRQTVMTVSIINT